MIFAEVIGDPIAQSKSPLIHKYWLDRLRSAGDYVRTRVPTDELASFIGGFPDPDSFEHCANQKPRRGCRVRSRAVTCLPSPRNSRYCCSRENQQCFRSALTPNGPRPPAAERVG